MAQVSLSQVARFETPKGTEIHHRGILPDYQVEGKEMDLGRQKADPQYEMAVKVLPNFCGSEQF